MSSNKYDFSEIEQQAMDEIEEGIDPRSNFRITQCCANCKYYFYTGVKSRRGFCKLLNTKHMNVGSYGKSKIDHIAEEYGWPPVHSTNVCDKHMLRSIYYSIELIEDYTGFKFEFDGTRRFELEEGEDDFEYDDDYDND